MTLGATVGEGPRTEGGVCCVCYFDPPVEVSPVPGVVLWGWGVVGGAVVSG